MFDSLIKKYTSFNGFFLQMDLCLITSNGTRCELTFTESNEFYFCSMSFFSLPSESKEAE